MASQCRDQIEHNQDQCGTTGILGISKSMKGIKKMVWLMALLLCSSVDMVLAERTTNEQFCDNDSCDEETDDPFSTNILPVKYQDMLYPDWVHVAIVACGDRQPETSVAVKAIMLTATDNVFVHIFTEDDLRPAFQKEFEEWPEEIRKKFNYRLYPITFPPSRFDEWKKLFKTCATQRLFIPYILRRVDSLLYIDTDILIMRPVQHVWAHFYEFNSTQLAAVAPEHESRSAGWYNRFARHPYYGELGINSGVMLMNLTRIRAFTWLDHMNDYYQKYRYNITWGDQDLLNVLFHFYPEFVYVYECDWNYRPDHCMYMSSCKIAEKNGISVIHGNRGTLHNDKQPAFKAIYDSINEYKFDGMKKLLTSMHAKLDMLVYDEGRCQAVKDLFIKQFRKYVRKENKLDKTEL